MNPTSCRMARQLISSPCQQRFEFTDRENHHTYSMPFLTCTQELLFQITPFNISLNHLPMRSSPRANYRIPHTHLPLTLPDVSRTQIPDTYRTFPRNFVSFPFRNVAPTLQLGTRQSDPERDKANPGVSGISTSRVLAWAAGLGKRCSYW